MLPADDPRHGTAGGYNNHACRCDRCRAANTEYMRRRRERVRAETERAPEPADC